jgi:Domain of unknown function (DUF1994).
MSKIYRRRQVVVLAMILLSLLVMLASVFFDQASDSAPIQESHQEMSDSNESLASVELEKLEIKEHQIASKYVRSEFGSGWSKWQSCDTRQKILARDLTGITYDENNCTVLTGKLDDPYTGKVIDFTRGASTSSAVQIDHVIALSNAWKTGASYWDRAQRVAFANDDLELIAVDGPANNQKSNADASEWLPSNVAFQCQYIARQIAVKVKYVLWVTQNEYNAMKNVLNTCPDQRLPSP